MIVHGIDFSGAAAPWRQGARRPSIWIATLDGATARPRLVSVVPVEALPGNGTPFERLVALLGARGFAAAAIDAPFSLPARHLPEGRHDALLRAVADLPPAPDRPFPRGAELLRLAEAVAPLGPSPKPMRTCERAWSARGVNVRSTLWNGPRGGAPFAVACLTLLARAGNPCWPWHRIGPGLLAEAFPAAQLRVWELPWTGYGRPDGGDARRLIVSALAARLEVSAETAELLATVPDALDATLAGFAALAIVTGAVEAEADPASPEAEGFIAVHR